MLSPLDQGKMRLRSGRTRLPMLQPRRHISLVFPEWRSGGFAFDQLTTQNDPGNFRFFAVEDFQHLFGSDFAHLPEGLPDSSQ